MKVNFTPITFCNNKYKNNPQNQSSSKKADMHNHSELVLSDSGHYANISFKGSNNDFSKELKSKLLTANEDELFCYFDTILREKVKEKELSKNFADDIVQCALIDIFSIFRKYEDNKITLNKLINEIDNIYQNIAIPQEEYNSRYRFISLDKKINQTNKHLHDIIPDCEENRIRYLRKKNNTELTPQRKKLDEAINRTNLSDIEKDLINQRYRQESLTQYTKIAKKYGKSDSTIRGIFERALMKIQIANNSLSPQTQKYIKEFAADYNLTTDKTKDILIKSPFLLRYSPADRKATIEGVVNKFEKYGLDAKTYTSCCLKFPQLFYISPATIEKNINDIVKKFKDNGLTHTNYISCCKKQPPLLCMRAETIAKNIEALTEKFQKSGLTTDACVSCFIKQPSLFCLQPDTLEANVKGMVKKFKKYGLDEKAYIACCIKTPQLLYQSPQTLEKNVKDFVEAFKDSGMTVKSHIASCIKTPQLFTMKSSTLAGNVKNVIENFKNKGLSRKNYIDICSKYPALYSLSPGTISEHIDILSLSAFNTGRDVDNKKFFDNIFKRPLDLGTSSSLLLTSHFIIPKMFENKKIPKELKGNHLKQKLNTYLSENSNTKYTLNIKILPTETDCLKILLDCLKQISTEALNRDDVFEIKII